MEALFAILLGYTGPYKDMFMLLGVVLAFAGSLWTVVRKERQHFIALDAQRAALAEEAKDMRDELRGEIDRLRTRLDEVESELGRLYQRNTVLERVVRQHGLQV